MMLTYLANSGGGRVVVYFDNGWKHSSTLSLSLSRPAGHSRLFFWCFCLNPALS